ncbi:hypothetical protein ACP70R_028614 [Stipagrostis hirtigluma subsp. patula]
MCYNSCSFLPFCVPDLVITVAVFLFHKTKMDSSDTEFAVDNNIAKTEENKLSDYVDNTTLLYDVDDKSRDAIPTSPTGNVSEEDCSADKNFSPSSLGFRFRIKNHFGAMLTDKMINAICQLFDSHCMELPRKDYKKTELLLINMLRLFEKSSVNNHSLFHDDDTTSYISGPIVDIMEFTDDSEIYAELNNEVIQQEDDIPDFDDAFCERFSRYVNIDDSSDPTSYPEFDDI